MQRLEVQRLQVRLLGVLARLQLVAMLRVQLVAMLRVQLVLVLALVQLPAARALARAQ